MKISLVGKFTKEQIRAISALTDNLDIYNKPQSVIVQEMKKDIVVVDSYELTLHYNLDNILNNIVIRYVDPSGKLKVKWSNGWGEEDGTQYPYSFWFELDGIKVLDIDLEFIEKFMQDHSSYMNGVGVNIFRGRNAKELTKLFYRKYTNKKE